MKATACCMERQGRREREDCPALANRRRFFRDRGFLPVDRSAYPVFRTFSQYSLLQEMSAPIIGSWSFAYHGLYKLIGGCLCTVYFHGAKPVYFTLHRPAGFPPASLPRIIEALYGLCREAALPFLQIRFVEERYLADFEGVRGYRVETLRRPQDDEYVYRAADLLDLSGTVNFYKRKRVRRCSALEGVSLRPMTNANVRDCLVIEDRWCQGKDCAYCASFGGCESKALRTMVELFDEEVHTGLLLYLPGASGGEEPAGYVICERISEKLAFLYFGKAVVEGFFVFLIYRLFRDQLHGVEYLNINEDMGSPGLRLFKSHLSAYELWPKYICTFTDKGADPLP